MLTFRFDGVTGEMLEADILTAGMVGKEVKLEFSEDWDGLRKAVVYQAGSICSTAVDVDEVEIIPAAVLSKSLQRLYVGVYGMSEDGTVVIPTIYARGPFIRIGAGDGDGVQDYDPEEPFWVEIEEVMEQTLHFTPQSLTEDQQKQARENIRAAKDNPEAVELLLTILRSGNYQEDQTQNIRFLTAALTGVMLFGVSNELEHMVTDNEETIVMEGEGYHAELTAEEGYFMQSVTVTMGGVDVTAEVVSDGVIDIPTVTGDIAITAVAVNWVPDGRYVPAEVSAGRITMKGYPSNRLSVVLTRPTAAKPFTQNGNLGLGDVYLIPVPKNAKKLTVECTGLMANPQMYAYSNGVYTLKRDLGWQAANGFNYVFAAGTYGYLAMNFKAPTNASVFTKGYDASFIRIAFE